MVCFNNNGVAFHFHLSRTLGIFANASVANMRTPIRFPDSTYSRQIVGASLAVGAGHARDWAVARMAALCPRVLLQGVLVASFLQLCDPIEQFQRQRGASKVDPEVTLQMNRGSHPAYTADVEMPLGCTIRIRPAFTWVENALSDHGDYFLSLHRAVAAQFFQCDESLLIDEIATEYVFACHGSGLKACAGVEGEFLLHLLVYPTMFCAIRRWQFDL